MSKRNRRWECLSRLALVCIVSACSSNGTEPLPIEETNPAKLQRLLDSLVTALDIPGAVVGIQSPDGKRLILSSGVENLATGAALDVQDRFRVGSVTKSMISTVILQLADEGKLDLDDRLSKYVALVATTSPLVTIRQLLNHTSGLFDYTDDNEFMAAAESNPARTWSPEELVAFANARSPLFSPGTTGKWSYSNTNYILLGLVIEKILAQPVATVLQTRIFTPLGMTKTFLAFTTDTPSPFSRGYADLGGGRNLDVASLVNPTIAGAAGAVVSNVGDLMVWSDALASGKLVSSASHTLQIDVIPASGIAAYGLGVERLGRWIGHTGDIPGYQTDMFTRPGVGTIVVLVNKSSDYPASREIFDAIRWVRFPLL